MVFNVRFLRPGFYTRGIILMLQALSRFTNTREKMIAMSEAYENLNQEGKTKVRMKKLANLIPAEILEKMTAIQLRKLFNTPKEVFWGDLVYIYPKVGKCCVLYRYDTMWNLKHKTKPVTEIMLEGEGFCLFTTTRAVYLLETNIKETIPFHLKQRIGW